MKPHSLINSPAILVGIAFGLTSLLATAQSYDIPSGTFPSGGGTSSAGSYSLEGTIGSTQSGTSSNGLYAVDGGFVGQYMALQQAGAPHLIIRTLNANQVQLAWPSSVPGWQLQSNSADLNPNAWMDVAIRPVTGVAEQSISVSACNGRVFFRLRKL